MERQGSVVQPVKALLCNRSPRVVVGADSELEVTQVAGRELHVDGDGLPFPVVTYDDAICILAARLVVTWSVISIPAHSALTAIPLPLSLQYSSIGHSANQPVK